MNTTLQTFKFWNANKSQADIGRRLDSLKTFVAEQTLRTVLGVYWLALLRFNFNYWGFSLCFSREANWTIVTLKRSRSGKKQKFELQIGDLDVKISAGLQRESKKRLIDVKMIV